MKRKQNQYTGWALEEPSQHVLEGNSALLKLDNDVFLETVIPSTTQLGNEHRKLGKAKSQGAEKAGHSSISHQSNVRGIRSCTATDPKGFQANGVTYVEHYSCHQGQLNICIETTGIFSVNTTLPVHHDEPLIYM